MTAEHTAGSSAAAAPAPARHRAVELDERFGDPLDPDNPLGHAAVVAADERAELLAAGEAMLDDFGLGADFVPAALGGRWTRLDDLIEIMRTVFRRDPCLGLGHGASSLIAAVNVWTGGRDDQRRSVAELLVGGGKLACGYFELAHGNDLARVDLTARRDGDVLRLDGGKQVISNLARADAAVLFARTSAAAGSRSHSQLLVERAALPAPSGGDPARFATAGMRGVQLGAIELRDWPVPADRVLGAAPGRGLELALTSFQLTRVALPGMFFGIVDTGLRTTVRYAHDRRLYGRTVADLPLTRAVLAEAFADLLICDCVVMTVARAVHVLPREASVATAATKFVVPRLLIDAMNRLSSVLGASFYVRRGEHAIFQKLLRDLPPASFGHLARVAAQMTLIPQLPLLARRGWATPEPAPAEVFALDAALPELPFDRLVLAGGGQDRLTASLRAVHDAVADGPTAAASASDRAALRPLLARFVAELDALREACSALAPHELTAAAPVESYDLAARYALVVAASASAGVWWHNQARGGFLADPAWLVAGLARLAARLGGEPAPPLPDELASRLFAELVARHDAGTGFDLANRALPGWQRARSHRFRTTERES
ncbi:MAG TPA: acyl-CoA dehydrogenase [Kofleriaceae bacterium]|nr:acyl-CoA dehydrogenase [Kofleriaceae bacterium]